VLPVSCKVLGLHDARRERWLEEGAVPVQMLLLDDVSRIFAVQNTAHGLPHLLEGVPIAFRRHRVLRLAIGFVAVRIPSSAADLFD
jgi:hypothetical protein